MASKPDSAEELFEAYCQNKGLSLERIPEKGNAKTPDYVLNVANMKIVIEIKESGTGPEKQASEKPVPEIGGTLTNRKLGKWVRKKIEKAGRQIRAYTKGKQPSMLVLFNGGQLMGDISPTDITAAMLGQPTVLFAIPTDPSKSPYPIGMRHGAGRKMTQSDNTSISAVAALWMKAPSDVQLHVYHNPYTGVPIQPSILSQYGIPQKVYDCNQGWFDYES